MNNIKEKSFLERFRTGSGFGSNRVAEFMHNVHQLAEAGLIASALTALLAYIFAVILAGSPVAVAVGAVTGFLRFKTLKAKALKASASISDVTVKQYPTATPALTFFKSVTANLKRNIDPISFGAVGWLCAVTLLGAKGLELWVVFNQARLINFFGLAVRIAPYKIQNAREILADPGLVSSYYNTFAITGWIAAGAFCAAAYFAKKILVQKALEVSNELADRHRRGKQLISNEQLITDICTIDKPKGWYGKGDYTWVGGIPLPAGRATYHFLVLGVTGAGKSQAIHPLMKQVRAKGKAAFVYDLTTEFTAAYYRKDFDVLLNPFDARFCERFGGGYTLFNEIHETTDYDQLTRAVFPIQDPNSSTEVYFKTGGATVMSVGMEYLASIGTTSNRAIEKLLMGTPQEDLYELFKDTRAGPFLNPKASGTGSGGFFTSLTNALDFLRFIPDGSFSVKEFCWAARDEWVFMATPQKYSTTLQPFMALVLGLVQVATTDASKVSRPQPEDRIWLFMDEFASMGHGPMKSIEKMAVEARQFGVVLLLGAQAITQTEELMNKARSETFVGMFQNKLFMKAGTAKSAEASATEIGAHEIDSMSESMSGGPSQAKDGIGNGWNVKDKVLLVTADEVASFAPNSGVVIVAGGYNPSKVAWVPQSYPAVVEGLISHPSLLLLKPPRRVKAEAAEGVEKVAGAGAVVDMETGEIIESLDATLSDAEIAAANGAELLRLQAFVAKSGRVKRKLLM